MHMMLPPLMNQGPKAQWPYPLARRAAEWFTCAVKD